MSFHLRNPEDLPIEGRADFVREQMLGEMSVPAHIFFKKLVTVLRQISQNSDVNRMTSTNLSIVWGPNLIRPSTREVDAALCASSNNGLFLFLQTCIEEYDAVFAAN